MLDHHTKAFYLAQSLQQAGFELAPLDDKFDFDVMLVDTDHPAGVPPPHKHNAVLEAVRRGIAVGLYPHGGLPILDYDGLREPLELAFELVHGEGHKRIYETIGLKRRVEVVGWTYCERVYRKDQILRSAKRPPIRHVLFAPIHPWANGEIILQIHQAYNEAAYRAFLDCPAEKKTVRMFGADTPNGVFRREPGIDYLESNLTLGVEVIDAADAVLSYGTFACTSLARGKPTVMIAPYPWHMSDDGETEVNTWAEYKDLTRYPASVGDGPLEELWGVDTSEWERLFVGGPLQMDKLASVLREYKR